MKLFYFVGSKYRDQSPAEILRKVLVDHRIKVSRLSFVNDPADFQVGFPEGSSDAYIRGFRNHYEHLDDVFGVVCFSETLFNVLMWSHYASNHEGFALELELDNRNLTKVVYSSAAPLLPQDDDPDKESLMELICSQVTKTKSLEWAYEKEWRRIVLLRNLPSDVVSDGPDYYLRLSPQSVKSVFAGIRSRISDDDIKAILEAANLPETHVYRMERTREGFGLTCDAYRSKNLREVLKALHASQMTSAHAP